MRRLLLVVLLAIGMVAAGAISAPATEVESVTLGTGLVNSVTKGWKLVALTGVKAGPYTFRTSEGLYVVAVFEETGTANTVKACASLGSLSSCTEVLPNGQNWPSFFLTFSFNEFPVLAPGNYELSVKVYDDGVENPENFTATIKIADAPYAQISAVEIGAGIKTTIKPGEKTVRVKTGLKKSHLLYLLPRLWVEGAKQFRIRADFIPASGAVIKRYSGWYLPNYQLWDGQAYVEVGCLPEGSYTQKVYIEYDARKARLAGDTDRALTIGP